MAQLPHRTHTAGPFHISGTDDGPGERCLHIGAAKSVTVLASLNPSHPDTLANAALFVASPDLVTALAALLPEVDAEIEQRQHNGNDEDWQYLKALSDAGHAALAKAEGPANV